MYNLNNSFACAIFLKTQQKVRGEAGWKDPF